MIAVAILAISLMALMDFQSHSLLASARAQHLSVATLLARQKMGEFILEVEKGIPKGDFPDEKEEQGTFETEKYPDYYWKLVIKKVELPAPNLPEGKSDIMGQALKMLTEELNRSTREVRLKVGWKEFEEENEGLEGVTHIVNPRGPR